MNVPDSEYHYDEVLAEIENQQTGRKSWMKNIFIVLISLVIFFQLGLFKRGVSDVLIVILVLAVHEAGHLLGMRLFGYKNVQMLFIPFFGAVISCQSQNVAAYKKALVALLGPVPGIFIGVFFGILYAVTKTPIYLQLTTVFLIINSFNLLPFFPLDGGRLMYEILFSRNRYAELCFKLLASLALIGIGLLLQFWLLAIFGLISLISVGFPFKLARIADELKPLLSVSDTQPIEAVPGQIAETETIPPEIARQIIHKIQQSFTVKMNAKTLATHTREIWDRMHLRPPGALATTGLLTIYLLCFCIPFMVLIGAAVISIAWETLIIERKIVEYQKPDGQTARKEQVYMFDRLTVETDVAADRLVYHGKGFMYYPDGKLFKEVNWRDGKWDGETKTYDQQGELMHITIFDKGNFVVRREPKNGSWVEKRLEDLPKFERPAPQNGPPLGPKASNTSQ